MRQNKPVLPELLLSKVFYLNRKANKYLTKDGKDTSYKNFKALKTAMGKNVRDGFSLLVVWKN